MHGKFDHFIRKIHNILIKAQYDNAYQLRKSKFIFVVCVIHTDGKTIFNYATFSSNQR